MHCKNLLRAPTLGFVLGSIAIGGVAFGAVASATPARSEALILVDADSGKVLRAENATYPWYPASVTKLMTLYMTLSAIRDHRITGDTLFTVSANASAQSPTKMGFPIGTQVTVDNAIKMMMVKSANDMAVLLAEGVGGSIDDFAQQMTATAHRLGMTESNFVNPNGLPADGQIVSARDLAILARALMHDFPDYSAYWHIPAIKYGRRIVRNYNPLIGRYPGADGMKTGFICASGFNLVATATRGNKTLIAVVLGAPSGAARAVKAAELLESGFTQNPLSWLTPSLGTVDALTPIDAAPPDLKDEMCGSHRHRKSAEEDDADADADANAGGGSAADSAGSTGTPHFAVLLSALRAPTPKNLLTDDAPITPIIVYTGPTRTPAEIANLAAMPDAVDPVKKKVKHKPAAAKAAAGKKAAADPADGAAKDGKLQKLQDGRAAVVPWTPMSSSALAASPPPDLKSDPPAAPAPKPHPPAANFQQ